MCEVVTGVGLEDRYTYTYVRQMVLQAQTIVVHWHRTKKNGEERYRRSPSATVWGGQNKSGRCHGKYEEKGRR